MKKTVSLQSIIAEDEADPVRATHLANARKKLAPTLYADSPETLSALRLAAGLSQMQLAVRCQTNQPHIASLELGENDPGTALIVRIARALGEDEGRVFRAIRNQLTLKAPT